MEDLELDPIPLGDRARLIAERIWQKRAADTLHRAGYGDPVLEKTIPNGRIDIVLGRRAIEVDFAAKWAECIGQALFYGVVTHAKPVCLLIVEKDSDRRFVDNVRKVAKNNTPPIEIWVLDAQKCTLDFDGRTLSVE